MNIDKRFIHYLCQLKYTFIASVMLTLLCSVVIVAQAALLSRVINAVFLEKNDLATVAPLLQLFAALALLRALTFFGSREGANKIAATVKDDLRHKLLSHLFRLGPTYARSQQTGELKNTLMAGVDALDAYVSDYLPQLLIAFFVPLLILIFVFPVDLSSGFILLLTAPLMPFFMILIGDIAQHRSQQQWTLLSRMSAHFLDLLQGLTTLKIFGRSKEQVEKIRSITDEFRTTTMKVLRIAFLSALVLEMLATISTAIVAVQLGLRLLYGRIAFERALFVLLLAPEFYQPLRQLGARFHAGMHGFVAVKRIFAILATPPQVARGLLPARPFSALSFQHVSFTHAGRETPALRDIQFTIARGEHIALVGPSGAGKTTLISLLLRFLDPGSGTIAVDGQSLVEIDAEEWRQQIAWVPQGPFLFHKTIAENLRIARENARPQELIAAATRAHIHDFFSSLPKGYDTVIGERGARLSGGQAQRLALARAFLKDAALIILDEPTAHLDDESERHICDSVAELTADKTVITIAHRLQTVEGADRIVVLNEGSIVDIGRHAELAERCSLYATLLHSMERAR
ncbi:thiol reductant ABC exporter subunit CydD [candidate division KSB1 bacterium]|nr:thiol reductant ABC exporter subunit CydD [candidate division KSB1 bacterium]